MRPLCHGCLRRLAGLIATKHSQSYSTTLRFIRYKTAFSLFSQQSCGLRFPFHAPPSPSICLEDHPLDLIHHQSVSTPQFELTGPCARIDVQKTKLFLVGAQTDDRALLEFSHVRTLTVAIPIPNSHCKTRAELHTKAIKTSNSL